MWRKDRKARGTVNEVYMLACNVKVNAIEYFHIKLNTNEEI